MLERIIGIFHKPREKYTFDNPLPCNWEKLANRQEDPGTYLADLKAADARRLMISDPDVIEVYAHINPGDPENSRIVVSRKIAVLPVAVGIGAGAGSLAILYGIYRLVKHFWEKRKIV